MRSADPTALWDTIRLGLSKQLPEASFKEWIAPCEPLKVKDGALWIQVPSAAAKLWIEQQLPEEFNDALAQGGLADLRLEFHISGAPAAEPKPSPKKVTRPNARGRSPRPSPFPTCSTATPSIASSSAPAASWLSLPQRPWWTATARPRRPSA